MDAESTSRKILKTVAGILGVFESVSWIALSIICIVLHLTDQLEISENPWMEHIRAILYRLFISPDDNVTFDGQILTPKYFQILEWIYLCDDLVWLILSINLLLKKGKTSPSAQKLWSVTTWIVCLVDLVTVIILGVDYNNCVNSFAVLDVCADGILPVLIISAKGFVLWIVNLVFSIILFMISRTSDGVSNKQQMFQPQPIFPRFNNPFNRSSRIQQSTPPNFRRTTQPTSLPPNNRRTTQPTSPPPNNRRTTQPTSPPPNDRRTPQRQWLVYSPSPSERAQFQIPNMYSRSPPNSLDWTSQANQKPFLLGPPPPKRRNT